MNGKHLWSGAGYICKNCGAIKDTHLDTGSCPHSDMIGAQGESEMRTPKVTSVNLTVLARFAKEGWRVRVHGNEQPYYLRKFISVVLPDHPRCDYRVALAEQDDGWVGVGYHGVAQYIRTISPNELLRVELPLDEATDLIERIRASSAGL